MFGKLRRPHLRPVIVIGGVVALLAIVGGVSLVSADSPSATISACVNNSSGEVKIVDPSTTTCQDNHHLLTWNQQGIQGVQGPVGPKGDTGPQGPAGVNAAAGESCPAGQFVTGFDSNGNILCAAPGTAIPPACADATFTFHITSSPSNTIEQWPGGQQTQSSAAGCSVTVQAPSGDIDLLGGTVGTDGWVVVSQTGFTNLIPEVANPVCNSVGASPDVIDNRPPCSNASSVFGSPSTDAFVVTAS